MSKLFLSGLAGLLLACAQVASGAAGGPAMFGTHDVLEVRIAMPLTRADEAAPIEIDGRLEETVWRDLPVISDFVVIEPDTLEVPPYATRAKLFYTSRGLYVGFDLEQPAELCFQLCSIGDEGGIFEPVTSATDVSAAGRNRSRAMPQPISQSDQRM